MHEACPPRCPKRSGDPNCHETCARYKAFREEMDKLMEIRAREREKAGYALRPEPVRERK